MRHDYERDDVLDRYDAEALGDDDIDENLDAAQRRAIEEELDRRDMADRLRGRDQDGDVVDDEEDDRDVLSEGDSEDDEAGDVEVEHLTGGNVKDWITEGRKRKAVKRRFKQFLLSFETASEGGKNEKIYPQRIRNMCSRNSASLLVSFAHLGEANPQLAIWLADWPLDMLAIFDEVLSEVVHSEGFFPSYHKITREVKVTDDDMSPSVRMCPHASGRVVVMCQGERFHPRCPQSTVG